ncbi:hypothetical protein D3C75_853160 [compost metagenome]
MRFQTGADQRLFNHIIEAAAFKHPGRHVNGDGNVGYACLVPELILAAHIMQHPIRDGHNKSSLLGDGNEFGRRNNAMFRVPPAQQRLQPDGYVHERIPFRLIDHHKF